MNFESRNLLIENDALLEGLCYGISNEKLWRLPALKTSFPLEYLKWNLFHKAWETAHGLSFAPVELLFDWNNKDYAHHQQRVINADLRFPIIVTIHPFFSKHFIYDGYHRLTKAALSDKKEVDVAIVDYRLIMEVA
jgi:hypothetical protein